MITVTFSPKQLCGLVKKQHFWYKKIWFHAIPRLFSFPSSLICKKWSKYNFTATAKFRRNRFSYSNTPKHAQSWLFRGIYSFFSVFEVYFFRTLNPLSACLLIRCGMKYPKWPIYASGVHKTELSNLTKNIIVLPPKHGGGGWGLS